MIGTKGNMVTQHDNIKPAKAAKKQVILEGISQKCL